MAEKATMAMAMGTQSYMGLEIRSQVLRGVTLNISNGRNNRKVRFYSVNQFEKKSLLYVMYSGTLLAD